MTIRVLFGALTLAISLQVFIYLRLDFKSRESAVEITAKRSAVIVSGAPATLGNAPLPGGFTLCTKQIEQGPHDRRAPR